jgi:hypothetical protein
MTSRVRNAYASGHLTATELDALILGNVFASGNAAARPGQVCAVAGRAIFDDDPAAVDLLLGLWGGEAVYWATHESTALAARLRTLGKPSTVVVNLRLPRPVLRPVALQALRRASPAVARDLW